jgi:hypothetical protein
MEQANIYAGRRAAAARRGVRGGIGDARFEEESTTDVWHDDRMLGDLAGPFSKLRKLQKRVVSKVKAVRKTASKAVKSVGKAAKDIRSVAQKVLSPKTHMGAIGKLFGKIGGSGGGGGGVEYDEPVESNPVSTGLAPPSIYTPSDGFSNPPAYDPWQNWDAQTEQQEVDSLFTPEGADMIDDDMELPAGDDPYSEYHDLPGTEEAYDEPAESGGEDYDTMQTDDPTEVYGDNSSPMLGDWLTDLAQQVLQSGATYANARLQADLAKRGQGTMPIVAAQPVQLPPTPQTIIQLPPEQAAVRRPMPRAASGAMKYGPWILGGVGAVLLFGLMKGVRRSR